MNRETQNTKSKTQNIKRMLSVEQLIANKMMLVDAEHYHVSMLGELWNLYYDEGKQHLCRNILNYCKVKNSFDAKTPPDKDVLLVSIKDSADNVAPYAYFRNGVIELIPNQDLVRKPYERVHKPFFKMIRKYILITLLIIAIISVLLWIWNR